MKLELRSVGETEADLWHFRLDEPIDGSSLTPDEHQRAERLKIPLVQSRFIVGRARLRQILSSYTGIYPPDLRFVYSPEGKPHLIPESMIGLPPLHFNLTHSNDHALLAVARVPVGVDLEQIRSISALENMTETAFTQRERLMLAQILSEERKKFTFFRLWTCKEAVMKAVGKGFKLAHQIEVEIPESSPVKLISVTTEAVIDEWTLIELDPPLGYTAALASPKTITSLSFINLA